VVGLGDVAQDVQPFEVLEAEVARDRLDHAQAARGVLLHLLALLRGQPAALEQDAVGHADLADVVQRRELEDALDHAVVERLAA